MGYMNNMDSKLFHLKLAIILCCYAGAVWCMPSRPSKCGISSNPAINRKPSDAVTKDEVCAKFKKLTGYAKPSKDQDIILYCHSGRRSTDALEIFRKKGYKNAKHFPGSASYWKCLKNEGFCPNP